MGVDIGGTAIKAAVVSSAGDLGEKVQAPSPHQLEELRDFFLNRERRRPPSPSQDVGIACKGIIDAESSRMNRLPGDLHFLQGSFLKDFVGS